ncbi:hypothetical protein SAMN04489712_101842 [Thermomonospora echinospora]|uniref:Amidohydrolase family protein n=1 Tax=Thermomonospora echinospora TaxID=1992 RepID=A0A1H5U2A4_9ACTN|nr:hypothetical protein SAMN04489712_101842 [Thermomonospora echinospora]
MTGRPAVSHVPLRPALQGWHRRPSLPRPDLRGPDRLPGKAADLADDLAASEAAEVVDAAGKIILPGAVDAHFHLGIHRDVGLSASLHCEQSELMRVFIDRVRANGDPQTLRAYHEGRPPLTERVAIGEATALAGHTGTDLNLLHLSGSDVVTPSRRPVARSAVTRGPRPLRTTSASTTRASTSAAAWAARSIRPSTPRPTTRSCGCAPRTARSTGRPPTTPVAGRRGRATSSGRRAPGSVVPRCSTRSSSARGTSGGASR